MALPFAGQGATSPAAGNAVLTYDTRMVEAARDVGVAVVAPGTLGDHDHGAGDIADVS